MSVLRALSLLVLAGGVVIANPLWAASCDAPRPIVFSAAHTSAELSGGIARGELECLTIAARGGQHMSVAVTSPEDNAVLQIWAPGWTLRHTEDGYIVKGEALPGTEEGVDARSWSGQLPRNGRYLFVVGMTRGGGDFTLRVEIR
jgi:hypothetical protein